MSKGPQRGHSWAYSRGCVPRGGSRAFWESEGPERGVEGLVGGSEGPQRGVEGLLALLRGPPEGRHRGVENLFGGF